MKTNKPTQYDIDRLKAWIEGNDWTVFTVLRHVSKSGMYREISVVIPVTSINGAVRSFVHPSYTVSGLLNRSYSENNGHNSVVCKGCGMDMGFDLIYNLSAVLYGDGYKIKQEWI
jgi:hypothetical protein